MNLLSAHNNKRFFNKYGFKLAMLLASFFVLAIILIISLNARKQSLTKSNNYQPTPIISKPIINNTPYKINEIISAHLFGNSGQVLSTSEQKAPKTKLDLTLQGILFTRDENLARAIIVAGKKRANLYSVGDTIKESRAEIKEIRNEEVIINRNGVLESLPLIKKINSGNNEIFVFSSADEQSNQTSQQRLNTQMSRATPSKPRKIRKPNFSGLDRKLKEIGEL